MQRLSLPARHLTRPRPLLLPAVPCRALARARRHRAPRAQLRPLLAFIAAALALHTVAARPTWLVDPTLHVRAGVDTNPVAVGGSASVLGTKDTATFAAGLSFALAAPTAPDRAAAKLSYATEVVRFDEWASENHTSHRLAFSSRSQAGDWHWSLDDSTLWIDGSRDTLASLAACNGNGTSLWRERRAQWQHRAKVFAQHEAGSTRIRIFGTLLDYDYLTRTEAGRASFADRSDLLAGVDAGWKRSDHSFWFVGARAGRQHQDTVPLPGGAFDYSNRYSRLIAGWEGKLTDATTLAFSAGPDFRRYDGHIDARVFPRRSHTLPWFDASLTSQLSPTVSLTAKTTRWAWLSSTGKSAYNDLAAELALAWSVTPKLSLRIATKAHQCSYFPSVRNDWETLNSLGATYKLSSTLQLTADVLHHHGWNELPSLSDRRFSRTMLSLGASLRL